MVELVGMKWIIRMSQGTKKRRMKISVFHCGDVEDHITMLTSTAGIKLESQMYEMFNSDWGSGRSMIWLMSRGMHRTMERA